MDKKEPPKSHDDLPDKNKKSNLKPDSGRNSDKKKTIKEVDHNVIEKDMEVHMKPKENKEFKIKLFLYEFFIIFLAVSLSFFVENIRENYIEHHKEMQYVKSLINDIKIDTTQLTSVIRDNRNQIRGIDTLLKEVENPNSKKIANSIYYYTFTYLSSGVFFTHTDRTISQLKNAGGLRLIQSKAASDSIISYDGSVHDAEMNSDYCLKVFYDLSKRQKELLDFKVLRKPNLKLLLSEPNLKLLNNDPKSVGLYYNEALYYCSTLANYRIKLVQLKKQAITLLATLKKEYKLE